VSAARNTSLMWAAPSRPTERLPEGALVVGDAAVECGLDMHDDLPHFRLIGTAVMSSWLSAGGLTTAGTEVQPQQRSVAQGDKLSSSPCRSKRRLKM
jgi:hypothetical protein